MRDISKQMETKKQLSHSVQPENQIKYNLHNWIYKLCDDSSDSLIGKVIKCLCGVLLACLFAKIEKPFLDNEKKRAEISELKSRKLENMANAKKTMAEAEAIKERLRMQRHKD